MKIYVASSWRNQFQPTIVKALREAGYEVYDFRDPAPGNTGFQWSEIDPDWVSWTTVGFRKALEHPIAEAGFESDMTALEECDLCVIVLPCGRSAHLELGFAAGAGKPTIIYSPDAHEPELMYKMCDSICATMQELLEDCANWASEIVLGTRQCRVCGCTDDCACPGGCWWVEDDLCSSCVGKEKNDARSR